MNAQLINPKEFNTVEEFKAAMNLDSVEGEWMDVARHLGVEIDPKGGRRSIYKAWKAQNEGVDGENTTTAKKSVATTVNVVNTMPDVKPEQPAAATVSVTIIDSVESVLGKSPRRKDYPQTEEGEDQFDADMTAWVMRKRELTEQPAAQPQPEVQAQPATEVVTPEQPVVDEQPAKPAKKQPAAKPTVSVPVVTPDSADNIDETALQLAKLLRSIKPEVKVETDHDKMHRMIQDAVSDEMQGVREDLRTVDMQLSTALVELQKQIQSGTHTIEVKVNDKAAVKVDGLVHERFEDILRHVSVRDNVMLVGPAGSGKTTVCENVAQALGLDFYCKSVCAQTSKAELLGYMDANGNFVSTEFRVAYQNGGVFVLDEIDAGNPNVIAVLNSALANNYCAFADGMIRKHEDFVLIACANTFGTGASREYVGRNQLDSATLDRFSVIEFGYDEKLETALSPDKKFCQFVQAARKELANERVVISPRASIQGGKLLAAGCTPQYVVQTRIVKGITPALADRVRTVFARIYK